MIRTTWNNERREDTFNGAESVREGLSTAKVLM